MDPTPPTSGHGMHSWYPLAAAPRCIIVCLGWEVGSSLPKCLCCMVVNNPCSEWDRSTITVVFQPTVQPMWRVTASNRWKRCSKLGWLCDIEQRCSASNNCSLSSWHGIWYQLFSQFVSHTSRGVWNWQNSKGSQVTGASDETTRSVWRRGPFSLENDFFSPLSLSSNLRISSLNYFKSSMDGGLLQHFNKNFKQSHLCWWCNETKISLHRSQVTGCNKLVGLVQYFYNRCMLHRGENEFLERLSFFG